MAKPNYNNLQPKKSSQLSILNAPFLKHEEDCLNEARLQPADYGVYTMKKIFWSPEPFYKRVLAAGGIITVQATIPGICST